MRSVEQNDNSYLGVNHLEGDRTPEKLTRMQYTKLFGSCLLGQPSDKVLT